MEKQGWRTVRFVSFLVAETRTRNSVRGFVRLSVRPFVSWCVGPSVRRSVLIESKSGKTSVLDTVCVCLCVEGVGVGDGVEVRMGVGCPCPPVRNDFVTTRHLFTGHLGLFCFVLCYGTILKSPGQLYEILNFRCEVDASTLLARCLFWLSEKTEDIEEKLEFSVQAFEAALR